MDAQVTPPTGGLVVAAHEAPDGSDPDAIYLGTGVASRRAVSTGRVPLDLLAMVIVADTQRRMRGAREVVHLIADEHALVNTFADAEAVRQAADVFEAGLLAAVRRLRLPAYRVIRASALDDPLHAELLAEAVERCGDPYAAREAADIEWARRRLGATVKVGWTMQPRLDVPVAGYDERYFDAVHRSLFGGSITTVYTPPGRRLGPQPNVCPYTDAPADRRLRLDSAPHELPALCQSSSMRRHLRRLVPVIAAALEIPGDEDLQGLLRRVLEVFAAGHDSSTKELSHAL